MSMDEGLFNNWRCVFSSGSILSSTAMDAVAHDIIVKERIDRGTQQVDAGGRSAFLEIAAGSGLGVAARDKIKIADLSLT